MSVQKKAGAGAPAKFREEPNRACEPGKPGMGVGVARHAAFPLGVVRGYKSGRSSWRETPVARSIGMTRFAGTRSHWYIACRVTPNLRASSGNPPTACAARSIAVCAFVMLHKVSKSYSHVKRVCS